MPDDTLNKARLRRAVEELLARDEDLAKIVDRCGVPPLWSRPPGFSTLVYIVFEQQVSLASGKATHERVKSLLPDFSPCAYLRLSDQALRAAGVSRQKIRYTRLIAAAIEDGSLPLTQLGRRCDEEARQLLTAITGIGHWTADVYLMAALRRPDLWPVGDLALVKAVREVKGFADSSGADPIQALGESYRPYRSVATRIYWRHYLHNA